MNFDTLKEAANVFLEELLEEEDVKPITAEQKARWPLDVRALTNKMQVGENIIVVPTNQVYVLDYYGGFEYIDAEHRTQIGDYTIFSREAGRVDEVLSSIFGE